MIWPLQELFDLVTGHPVDSLIWIKPTSSKCLELTSCPTDWDKARPKAPEMTSHRNFSFLSRPSPPMHPNYSTEVSFVSLHFFHGKRQDYNLVLAWVWHNFPTGNGWELALSTSLESRVLLSISLDFSSKFSDSLSLPPFDVLWRSLIFGYLGVSFLYISFFFCSLQKNNNTTTQLSPNEDTDSK